MIIPKYMFFTRGVGYHKLKLASFELALRQAGIEKFNLVPVSSIFPPQCKIITCAQAMTGKGDIPKMGPGQVVFAVISRNDTNENGRIVSAGVGLSQPVDSNMYGYLSEVHEYGMDAAQTSELAEDLAAEMLASTLGLPFDPDKSWNERKEQWAIDGKIYHPRSIVQVAKGKTKMYTSVVAAAVFVC